MNSNDIAQDIAQENAQKNLEKLTRNRYPGRGIIIGMDETGQNMVQIYWIMGRSSGSRNRLFGSENGRLFTEPADPSKVRDSSLIIYDAMMEKGVHFVVSNGSQTEGTLQSLADASLTYCRALAKYTYEPDAPIYTPRINGICWLGSKPIFELAIIKKSWWNNSCNRFFWKYDPIHPGFGFYISTYAEDGDPPPDFTGEPLLVPLCGDIETIAQTYWQTLNEPNRVSLAVKFISTKSRASTIHIINKYKKV